MTKAALPKADDLRATLAALLGRTVGVGKAKEQGLKPNVFAPYFGDEGTLHAVAGYELSLAAGMGGALSMVPATVVAEGVRAGKLGVGESDGFVEVCNILAQLLNVPDSPHVVIGQVTLPPTKPDAAVAALATSGGTRVVFQIDVDGYGGGRVVFVTE